MPYDIRVFQRVPPNRSGIYSLPERERFRADAGKSGQSSAPKRDFERESGRNSAPMRDDYKFPGLDLGLAGPNSSPVRDIPPGIALTASRYGIAEIPALLGRLTMANGASALSVNWRRRGGRRRLSRIGGEFWPDFGQWSDKRWGKTGEPSRPNVGRFEGRYPASVGSLTSVNASQRRGAKGWAPDRRRDECGDAGRARASNSRIRGEFCHARTGVEA
jgi:hypothetical protein